MTTSVARGQEGSLLHMEGTTCERRTGPLVATKSPCREILVKLPGGVSASHHRSLLHGDREDGGSKTRQVQEGNGIRGLVAGLSCGTNRGFLQRRSRLCD